MRIAAIQFDIKLKNVVGNILRATSLLESLKEKPDLVVLPEMSFTGYLFDDHKDIKPYLERFTQDEKLMGPSLFWATQIAKRYNFNVAVGYPEISDEIEDGQPKLFNSCTVVGRTGSILHHYRKHFLFEAELGWCSSGSGFSSFDLDGVKTSIGICMDLNYSEPELFYEYEFATYLLEDEVELVLMPMNWLMSDVSQPLISSNETQVYWLSRLQPLLDHSNTGNPIHVVCCNRIGKEKETTFVGTSSLFRFSSLVENDSNSKVCATNQTNILKAAFGPGVTKPLMDTCGNFETLASLGPIKEGVLVHNVVF